MKRIKIPLERKAETPISSMVSQNKFKSINAMNITIMTQKRGDTIGSGFISPSVASFFLKKS
jgi:hypothetical protein